MANSNSQLLNYIGHLMSNDDALHHFLADPITNAEKAGLTKAERAVMRRVVTHLSNNALNGYSITRDPSSYRRSLRLLQNVLRHVGAKMLQDHQQMLGHVAPELVRSEADPTDSNTYTLEIYLPDTTGGEYYLKTNRDIGNAYAVPVGPFSVSMSSDSPTIYEVMEAAKSMYPGTFDFAYTADSNGNNSVSSFTYNGNTYTVDLNNPQYVDDYDPTKQNPNNSEGRYAFWFYSINGKAGQTDGSQYAPNVTANETKFFDSYKLSPTDHVIWQLIAPDSSYGFQSCNPGSNTAFALKKKAAAVE